MSQAGFGAFGGAAAPNQPAIVTPIAEGGISTLEDEIPVVEHPLSDDSSAGLTVLPADYVDESLDPDRMSDLGKVSPPDPVASEPRSLADALPEVVAALDEDLPVQAETTKMGAPHMIDYTLHFDSASMVAADGSAPAKEESSDAKDSDKDGDAEDTHPQVANFHNDDIGTGDKPSP